MRSKLNGFTLVELLVVIAIISVLIALLLPAVQAAREAARRSQCANNLKQLSAAVLNYESGQRRLPFSVSYYAVDDPETCGSTTVPCNGRGWILSILPQLEQSGLFNQFSVCQAGNFNSGAGIGSLTCRTALATPLTTLHCPSDESVLNLECEQAQLKARGVKEAARTSYKGVAGDNGSSASAFPGGLPLDCLGAYTSRECRGLLWLHNYLTPKKIKDISDGTSNTLLIGEDIPKYAAAHTAAYFSNGDYAACYVPLNTKVEPGQPGSEWYNAIGFRSDHAGGVQFAFCDGSVRILEETIEPKVYRALSTRAGEEVASLP